MRCLRPFDLNRCCATREFIKTPTCTYNFPCQWFPAETCREGGTHAPHLHPHDIISGATREAMPDGASRSGSKTRALAE